MEEIYQGYIHLTAEQLKLLCFLAYTGKSTTKQVLDSYAKGENIAQANMSKLVSDIKPYLMSNYFFYDDDHQLMPQHLGPLLVYLLCEHPDWLRNFERKYSPAACLPRTAHPTVAPVHHGTLRATSADDERHGSQPHPRRPGPS